MPIIVLGSTFGMSFALKALYAGSASASKRARMMAGAATSGSTVMRQCHAYARTILNMPGPSHSLGRTSNPCRS